MASLIPGGSASGSAEDTNGTRNWAASISALRTRPRSKSRNRTPALVTRLLSGLRSTGLNARQADERARSRARAVSLLISAGTRTRAFSSSRPGSPAYAASSGPSFSLTGPPSLRSNASKSASRPAVVACIRLRASA